MSWRGLLGLLCCIVWALPCSARSLEQIEESGYIEFAIYRDFPPYSFVSDGAPAGVDVELGKAIAAELGLEPRWFWLTADETVDDDLRNAVWKGSVIERRVADVMLRVPYDRQYSYAIDGYGLPRHDRVVMLAPYQTESWVMARDLNKTAKVRNLAIFQHQPIGVELDSLPDFFLTGFLAGRLRDNVRHYLRIDQALSDLLAGQLSAVAGMRSQLEWGLRTRPDYIDIDSDGLEAMGRLSWDIGIAIRHDFRPLGYRLQGIIADLVSSGAMAEMMAGQGLSYTAPSYYDSAVDTPSN